LVLADTKIPTSSGTLVKKIVYSYKIDLYMNVENDQKNALENVKVSLSFKELIGVGSFLIYLGIAIAGYYYLRQQVATTAEDFEQLEKDVSGIVRNLDIIQMKQNESINKLNEVASKLNDMDRKIDNIGYDIKTIADKK